MNHPKRKPYGRVEDALLLSKKILAYSAAFLPGLLHLFSVDIKWIAFTNFVLGLVMLSVDHYIREVVHWNTEMEKPTEVVKPFEDGG